MNSERCFKLAADLWDTIPWDSNLPAAVIGQYVDTRFLFEVRDLAFQLRVKDLRCQWLTATHPLTSIGSRTRR